jgi:CTP:molybdopterin cytidylyltransferase MocA
VVRLLAAVGQGQGQGQAVDAATPVCNGKGGHPVVCRGSVLERFRFKGDTTPLRDVLRALGPRRVRVETDDREILVDLDTPEDVVAWTGAPPAFQGE